MLKLIQICILIALGYYLCMVGKEGRNVAEDIGNTVAFCSGIVEGVGQGIGEAHKASKLASETVDALKSGKAEQVFNGTKK